MLIFKLRCFEPYNLQNCRQRISLYTPHPTLDESRDLTKCSIGRLGEMASDVLRVTKQAKGHMYCLF